MTVTEIVREIRQLTDAEFADLRENVRFEAALREQGKARMFKPGEMVEFDARGRLWTGSVVKVNQKSVSVKCDGGMNWKVGASLLRRVAA